MLNGTGMLGIDAQWTYTYNGTMTIHAYHCPRFFTTWWDGEAQQTAFVWVSKRKLLNPPNNPLWQTLRIVSTTSTGPNCDFYSPDCHGEGSVHGELSAPSPNSTSLLLSDHINESVVPKSPIENPCDGDQD